MHHTLTSGRDWEGRGVSIINMSSLTWGSVYDPFASEYTVPNEVVICTGGE